ncbi:hypothetical protein [Algirhabdus cladophorae]|uniref:hypothetical protein n=1 Tax=Algirhabdus cladophorae TaxID=3377108 RepID=UPI003B8452A2
MPKDDVGFFIDALMRVDTGKTKSTAKDPFRGGAQGGWHQQKEQFMRGYTHGEYVRGKLKSAKIYPVDNRIPQIALANAVYTYVHALTSSSTPSDAKAQGWVEWDKVKTLKTLETSIDAAITLNTSQLKIAMREKSFTAHVNTLNPLDYINCASELIEALQRGGQLADYMKQVANNPTATPADRDVLDSQRMLDIFDMLELKDETKTTLQIKSGANFNGAKITAANLKAWNDYITKTPAHYIFKRVTDFRSKAIPALLMWKHRGLTTLTSTDFDAFTTDVLSRGTGMFYPKGTFKPNMTLTEMQDAATEFDGAQFKRWKALDVGITKVADSFTVNSGTLLGMFGFAASVTQLYTAPNFKAQDVMGVMSAGVAMTDDIVLRYAAFGVDKGSDFLRASSGAAKALSAVALKRVIFVFGIIDAARAAHNLTNSTSTGEIVGNALVLLGALSGLGATGVGMLVGAGLLSIPAAPLVIAGLISAAVTIIGSLIASTYKVTDQEKILSASALGTSKTLRKAAASLAASSNEVHKGFTSGSGSALKDDYDAQLARVRGLANGMRLKIVDTVLSSKVDYEWQSTPFHNDLNKLSEDLGKLTIAMTSRDSGRPDASEVLPAIRGTGKASLLATPTTIDQSTQIDAQQSYGEHFEVAIMRRLAHKSGKAVDVPSAPPRMTFLERATA